MLSKAQIKHITALRTKKKRIEHAQFVVEGKKSVEALMSSGYKVIDIYFTDENHDFVDKLNFSNCTKIESYQYNKISNQNKPEGILALVKMPNSKKLALENKNYIALDQIRDPGNLGTIIRIADWFGVENVICSEDCVELYNPKVIQASMGSIFNINVYYTNLAECLSKTEQPKFAALLGGQSIYHIKAVNNGILIIGNEANGISNEVLAQCNQQITIPAKGKAESLNAAMACGILSSYLFR